MKGMDAVTKSITDASERISKLLDAGRIDPDSTVHALRRTLTKAIILAEEVRSKELIRKEVMTQGGRDTAHAHTSGAEGVSTEDRNGQA